tara:strand:- start:126 stop:1010 length:885 start_codon:yes stop_codon:yes gene_type:complete
VTSSNISPSDYMLDLGVRSLFYNRSYYRSESDNDKLSNIIRTEVLKEESIISQHIERSIDEGDYDFMSSMFDHAKHNDLNLAKISFWKDSIERISSSLLSDDTSCYHVCNGHQDHAISAALMLDEYSWDKLFEKVFQAQKGNNYIRSSYATILSKYAENFSESFKTFVEEQVFSAKEGKPSYATRGSLYKRYVSSGFLTKKTARKIRSDASSDASVAGLQALFENKDKYSNYDELLLQFTDSKYEDVVVALAHNLPEYLIASIMGTEFFYAKRAIQGRMEQIERDRAAISQGAL